MIDFGSRQLLKLTENQIRKNNIVDSHLKDRCQLVIVPKRTSLGEAVSKGLMAARQHLVFIDLSCIKCIFVNNYFPNLLIFLFCFCECFVLFKSYFDEACFKRDICSNVVARAQKTQDRLRKLYDVVLITSRKFTIQRR